ncbi:MAG: RNA polymerase sigma factor [Ignavibacteria bacterium]|nr:RNA polymerase sigma factor [Ignavibacteria bacterium]
MSTEIPDNDLIRQFTSGDEKAFNILITRYQDKIYWHARRMAGNHADAYDIVQEVLWVVYNKLKDFKFQSSFYTWVYTITSTRSLNFLRKKKLRQFFSLDDEENPIDLTSDSDILTEIGNKEEFDRVQKILQKLPAKQREVFILRNYEQMSYEEISQIKGTSVGALKANYFHAVEKLQKLMQNE